MEKYLKSIPETERGRPLPFIAPSGQRYLVTRHIQKRLFYLWRVTEEDAMKLAEDSDQYNLFKTMSEMNAKGVL